MRNFRRFARVAILPFALGMLVAIQIKQYRATLGLGKPAKHEAVRQLVQSMHNVDNQNDAGYFHGEREAMMAEENENLAAHAAPGDLPLDEDYDNENDEESPHELEKGGWQHDYNVDPFQPDPNDPDDPNGVEKPQPEPKKKRKRKRKRNNNNNQQQPMQQQNPVPAPPGGLVGGDEEQELNNYEDDDDYDNDDDHVEDGRRRLLPGEIVDPQIPGVINGPAPRWAVKAPIQPIGAGAPQDSVVDAPIVPQPRQDSNMQVYSDPPHCKPFVPCEYENEVGVRIMLITQKRWESLKKTLESLRNLVTDGETASLEIWIDRLKTGEIDKATYKVAREFQWSQGTKRVHLQERNVGILGQWIDTWRAKPGSKEIGLILEDDIDVSPYFYRWLRNMQRVFGGYRFISGYTLQDEHIYASGRHFLRRQDTDPTFLYRLHGCWGFSPHADRWREFQQWYHINSKNASFHPYVWDATTHQSWYRKFEKRGTQGSMWEMWYYRYAYEKGLWAVHDNLRTFGKKDQGLSFNRREPGLHFKRKKGVPSSDNKLLQTWDNSYVDIPNRVKMYGYNGKVVKMFEPSTGEWKDP